MNLNTKAFIYQIKTEMYCTRSLESFSTLTDQQRAESLLILLNRMLQSQFIHMSNNPDEVGYYAVDKKILKGMPGTTKSSLLLL